MYLKEAFEYANCLNKIGSELSLIFMQPVYLCKVTENHLRSKVDSSLEDEVVDVTETTYEPEKLFRIQEILLEDSMNLSRAIAKGKRTLDFDLDARIACNKALRKTISDMQTILTIRDTSSKKEDYGYRMNADGNQVMYRYRVVVESEPNFDREKLIATMRQKMKEADEASLEIEQAMVLTPVVFEPHFDYRGLSLQDIYELI